MDNNVVKLRLKLNGVFIEDKGGGFSGFFAQIPEVIAEGETEEEVTRNLFEAVQNAWESIKDDVQDKIIEKDNVIEKEFDLELS
jgi:predicted RNase H-like HicB family nuclease